MNDRIAYGSDSATVGGVVAHVESGSPAARSGIRPGDVIESVDGQRVRDVIDWRWHTDGVAVRLTVRDSESGARRSTDVVRESGTDWGIEFEKPLFDGVRACRNDCEFCFMSQLPAGLRPALYLRDDDYRLSFLSGNFITLTNLSDADVERIAEQRLSPLFVSLHAVDAEVRARLVRSRTDDALKRFDQLLDAGIDLHVQIVLVRDVNDGEVLARTLTWLAEREGVLSVGIVPVGYTRFRDTPIESFTAAKEAIAVIEQVQQWQFAMRERDGQTWVHLADEFYLNARVPVPGADWYDGFPQYENGIGMVRAFVDDVRAARPEIEAALLGLPADEERLTLVTGVMAATTIAGALEACNAQGRVRLLVVPNAFLGGNVTVAGLLAGRDVVSGIENDAHDGVYVVPDVMFNDDGLTLDDMTVEQMRTRTGARIEVVSADAEGVHAAIRVAAH